MQEGEKRVSDGCGGSIYGFGPPPSKMENRFGIDLNFQNFEIGIFSY